MNARYWGRLRIVDAAFVSRSDPVVLIAIAA
jgi:hypothetical protein